MASDQTWMRALLDRSIRHGDRTAALVAACSTFDQDPTLESSCCSASPPRRWGSSLQHWAPGLLRSFLRITIVSAACNRPGQTRRLRRRSRLQLLS